MDRSGQQLKYSNGMLNSVSVKTEQKIGYCEMYRSKNGCLCMTVKDKKSEFSALPKCNGMCPKQNINIFIENYETRINNETYDLKCDSAKLHSYPYNEDGQAICQDTVWCEPSSKIDRTRSWESPKNISNVTYYPYLNSQYIAERSSCRKTQIADKSSINHVKVNISKEGNTLLCDEINKNYLFRGNTEYDKRVLNAVPEQDGSLIVSDTVPSSPCNNLYVAPPCFTVDKFVNQEQADTMNNTQSNSFCNRNYYKNQRVPSNIGFEYNAPENHTVHTGKNMLINNMEQLIGIKLVENTNIPVMRLKASVEPIGLDIRKQPHLTYRNELCNENDYISSKIENYQWNENIHVNVPYISDLNSRTNYIQNNNNPVAFSIENGTNSIELKNQHLHGIADFSATYNTTKSSQRSFQDFKNTYLNKNSHESCTKQSCSNFLPPSTKSIIRETLKPNYRELINHVHALRSATSEDDLNMQIIKRTLNYNQPNTILSRKLSGKIYRRSEDNTFLRFQGNNISEETYEKNLKNFEHQRLFGVTTTIASPLDLSVKTIKTKADSTENNCKVAVIEKGYPPKFNFRPDFSENRNLISNVDIKGANRTISNTTCVNRSSYKSSQVDTEIPKHFSEYNSKKTINLNIGGTTVGCKVENELIPSMKGNNVCNIQNCIEPQTVQSCASQERSEKSRGIKLEVTLKRNTAFDTDDDSKILHKRMCFNNFYNSGFNSSSSDNCSKSPDVNIKKTIKSSETTSNIDSVFNANSEQITINENTKNAYINAIVDTREIAAKNDPIIINKLQTNVIENKQDVSSIIAARIRTKAELKGFTFQEEKGVFLQEPLSNKENCHCNYDTHPSVQMDEVDLSAWGNTCNDFVDQLTKNFNPEIKGSKLYHDKISIMSLPKIKYVESKNINTTNAMVFKHANFSEQSKKKIVEFKEGLVGDTSAMNRINTSTQDSLEMNAKDSILKEKTDLKCNEFKNNYSVMSPHTTISRIDKTGTYLEENTPNHVNGYRDDFERAQDCMQNNQSLAVNKLAAEYATRNKNDEGKFLTNNSRAIDLTKISVVRLKREKYALKRFPCDNLRLKLKNGNSDQLHFNRTMEDLASNRHGKKIGRVFSSITKSTLGRPKISKECVRRRQKHVNTSIENKECKFSTITTRLRHQRTQLQNETKSIDNSNKVNRSKNKNNRLLRYQKQSERELSNDHDKLYLEVYRYKRALKIPPNLITIRNPRTHKMSTSLPDLDFDVTNSLVRNEVLHSSIDCKGKDVPKSIIDVLHSRVVKSKCQIKNTQKHSKNENQHITKLTMQQCSNSKPNFEPLNLCDSNSYPYQERRNVFETQILTSRTRMEYKLQLNKEVIREIFGGSERPASAPPEIINASSDYEIAFDEGYNKYCEQVSFGTEENFKNKLGGGHHKEFRKCLPKNLEETKHVINRDAREKTEDSHQSTLSNKCRRKKSGRPYRRKFSSGFDYLRKRKKSNTHGLYICPHLKTRAENYITEENLKLKTEDDVSREIQKWVLNKGVGQSALHKAARLGYIDVIVYCLEKMGLNPDHKDNAGYTPLHDACVNGSLEIAKVLLQYGANHSEGAHSGIRPLHEASENGHIEIVRMLLSYGADPLLETYTGQTPLMLASDTEMNDFISMHLLDVQLNDKIRNTWRFQGPWKIFDATENGYDAFNDVLSLDTLYLDGKISFKNKNCVSPDFHYFQGKTKNFVSNVCGMKLLSSQNRSLKNDLSEFEVFVDAADAEGELFEFEEANMPLPPLYLLKDEGMEKWVLLSDLCSLLKVKSKDTLLNKIFPSTSPATVNRAFVKELKMCEFLEKATCLQLLCAGEKINICHSKVVLIRYNENVRKILGVKTVFMKF